MTTTTKERPIIFSAPMVQAILAGRKSQTRRVVKMEADGCYATVAEHGINRVPHSVASIVRDVRCPYGSPGDRLWVREAVWCYERLPIGRNGQMLWPRFRNDESARAWFDKTCEYTADWRQGQEPAEDDGGLLNKMFMPHWASRLTLEITGVRVERLQEVSHDDAVAEGCRSLPVDCGKCNAGICSIHQPPQGQYAALWQSIHGHGSWAANPWVWVIEFKRVN
jgi:hypothetical protein